MIVQEHELKEVSRHFQIYGEILHAEPLKIGHINETYTATYDQGGTRVAVAQVSYILLGGAGGKGTAEGG